MFYWESIGDKLLLIIAMYVAIILYSSSIEWRKKEFPYIFICIAALVGLCFLAEETRGITGESRIAANIVKNIIEILFIVAVSASTLLIRKFNKANFLFVCIAAYSTFYLADNINSLGFSLLFGPNGVLPEIGKVGEGIFRGVMALAIHAATYALCWAIFIKRHKNSANYVADKSAIIVFVLILCVNLFIGEFPEIGSEINLLFVNKMLSCVLVLFVLYNQSGHLNSREENARLSLMIEQQKSQYETTKQIIEQVNVKAHDLKHFVEIFQSRGDMPKDILSELKDVGNSYENIYNTGSEALDITLTEKCSRFSENNIEFSVLADGSLLSFMSDTDIYVLFGNLIENAKEAVLREDASNRVIGLYLKRTENFIALHTENTCTNIPQFSDGLPITSKEDKLNHGLGSKSIQLVVSKYNGNLRMDSDGKLFTVDIVFFADMTEKE